MDCIDDYCPGNGDHLSLWNHQTVLSNYLNDELFNFSKVLTVCLSQGTCYVFIKVGMSMKYSLHKTNLKEYNNLRL